MGTEAIQLPDNETAEGLLADLVAVQRERFSGRMDALTEQGVEPADAWQVASTSQRQADLPAYEPTEEEQDAVERAARQVAGEPVQEEDAGRSLGAEELFPGLVGGVSGADGDGSSGGKERQREEEPVIEGVQPEEDPQTTAAELSALAQGRGSSDRSSAVIDREDEDAAPSDSDGETDDPNEIDQDVLDNALEEFNQAVAEGLVPDSAGELREADERPQPLMGDREATSRLPVKDKEMEVGEEESGGMTVSDADQESWRESQESEENLQQEQAQRVPQRRQRRSELEL